MANVDCLKVSNYTAAASGNDAPGTGNDNVENTGDVEVLYVTFLVGAVMVFAGLAAKKRFA